MKRALLTGLCVLILADVASAQQWQFIAPMKRARGWTHAIALNTGKILVIGGTDGTQVYQSCELYDPESNTWTDAAPMNVPRYIFQAFLLPDGRVFVAGGRTSVSDQATATCEIYDPVRNRWEMTASMNDARVAPAACMLPGNKIAIIGGYEANKKVYLTSGDIYDIKSGQMTTLPPQVTPTSFISAVYSQPANSIFVFGGNQSGSQQVYKTSMTQKFSLADWRWSLVDSMIARQAAQFNTIIDPLTSEVFLFTNDTLYPYSLTPHNEALNPLSGHWRTTGTVTPRTDPRAILIGDSVMITGGTDGGGNPMANCDWYSFASEQSTVAPRLLDPLTAHSNVYALLPDLSMPCLVTRSLFVMGGKTSSGYTAKCELLKLGAYSVDSSSTMELHRSIASAYYGHPDSLSMLLDVSTSVNLDSLWPALQQISATYSWDSSIIRFDGYAPPEGWVITGMAVHGNSADFTIDNISSSPTHPLDLGTAIFLPKMQSLTASNVTLQELTLQTSGGLLTPCISDNEDQHWAVKVLGLAGVETEQSSPALAIDWMRVESGTLTIGYHASDAMPSVRFELYDMLGREVQTQQSRSATTVSIDLTNLPTGSYVVRATDGASMVTKLIEIQR